MNVLNTVKERVKEITLKHQMGEHPQLRHGNRGTSALPDTIQTMIDQMGGRGTRGAFTYVGAQNLMYNQKTKEGTPNETRYFPEHGTFDVDTGLTFNVNMGKGSQWKMIVAYQPSDTYSVFLWRGFRGEKAAKTGKMGEAVTKIHDVYADELQHTVESVYDDAIKKYKGVFIPLY